MSKKINWAEIQKLPFENRKLGVSGYTSGKQMMAKAYATAESYQKIEANLAEIKPAMETLFALRLSRGTPFKVLRPLAYLGSEFIKSESSYGIGVFKDITKTVNPGDTLLIKSIDKPMGLFIFTDNRGNEIEIAFNDREKIMMATDVYEVCASLRS